MIAVRAVVPVDAPTEMTAARIGPAHGAQTKPSAAPTPSPDQKPVPPRLGAEPGQPGQGCLHPR